MCLKKDFKVSGGVAAKFHLREIRNQIQLELQIEIHNEICCGNTKKIRDKIRLGIQQEIHNEIRCGNTIENTNL